MENGEVKEVEEVQEPDENTKRLWSLYAQTAGAIQACVQNHYTAKQCRALIIALQKSWEEIYGAEYMQNAMKTNTTFIYFTALRA